MTEVVRFFVSGMPVTQGSKTVRQHAGKAWLVDVNDKSLKAWRYLINKVAAEAMDTAGRQPLDTAVEVHATFYLPKPESVKRLYPHVMPDVDKLLRALFDSLQPCFVNDSRVTHVTAAKEYANDLGPGVLVTILEKN